MNSFVWSYSKLTQWFEHGVSYVCVCARGVNELEDPKLEYWRFTEKTWNEKIFRPKYEMSFDKKNLESDKRVWKAMLVKGERSPRNPAMGNRSPWNPAEELGSCEVILEMKWERKWFYERVKENDGI